MIRYFVIVYGMGGAWLWWLFMARGSSRTIGAIVLLALTGLLALSTWRRARRLHSRWEHIPSRAITHVWIGESRWNREGTDRPEDPNDFETTVGGGF